MFKRKRRMENRKDFRNGLQGFAQVTRHRQAHYETPEQTAHLAKKMMASTVTAVPREYVYPFIASDLERMIQRMKPLKLDEVTLPDSFYASLATEMTVEPSYGLEHFSTHLGHDAGIGLALYMAKASNANLREVVKLLPVKNKEQLYDLAVSYGPLCHPRDNPKIVAQEIGMMLASAKFPNITTMYLADDAPLQFPMEEVDNSLNSLQSPEIEENEENEEGEEEDNIEDLLQENISIQEWKHRHALHPYSSSVNAAKQLLVQKYAPEMTHLLANTFGKYQNVDMLESQEECSRYSDENTIPIIQAFISVAKPKTIEQMCEVAKVKPLETVKRTRDLLCKLAPEHTEKFIHSLFTK